MHLPLVALIDHSHVPVLLVMGFAVFAGTFGARLFQWLRMPQVVGYIVIGLLVGRSGLNLVDEATIKSLLPFNFFALGVIGFMIGGELRADAFRRYGKQFIAILLAEGMGAFLLVSVATTVVMVLFTHDVPSAIAFGLVLGAICSATDPATTVNVLWEYKTRGVVTSTAFAIVGLDDGLALLLYAVASSVAMRLTGQSSVSFLEGLGHTAHEVLGAMALGFVAGLLLNWILRIARDADKALAFMVGTLAVVLGLARLAEMDQIIAAMMLGVTLANLAPQRSKSAFETMRRFAPPIYVLFFVFVGARLTVHGLPSWMWLVVLTYVCGRTAGKMLGAYLGARWARAAETVRKYLGFCLFGQAGVSIGLAIMASVTFSEQMGTAIIMIVTTTTFIVQIIGPPFVKMAVTKAGEVGLDITEEDLMESYRVRDVMDPHPPSFAESATLAEQELSGLMLAYDLMLPVRDTVSEDAPLREAVATMREKGLESVVVVAGEDGSKLAGMLELKAVNRRMSQELLSRRQRAGAA